jgi:hypothetical protein
MHPASFTECKLCAADGSRCDSACGLAVHLKRLRKGTPAIRGLDIENIPLTRVPTKVDQVQNPLFVDGELRL